MEVINKADTKLFSLFYISKGKSMQINCIFSKMTKIYNLTPCLWHPIWTTCWSLILTKIDIKYLKIPLYNRIVCILCYCTTCGLYRGRKLVKMGKIHFLTTCWSLIFTKIHKKYLKISLYKWVVCILCYYTTCGLYRGRNLVKNGENSFFDTLFFIPYLDHLLKSDLHQNWHKISQDTPLQLSGVYFMLLYNL